MNEIVWLSHGWPGSGRYPKGSGENPRGEIRKKLRESNKIRKKEAVNTYYINKKIGNIERKQYKIRKYEYKGKDATKIKNKENKLQSDLNKMKKYSTSNVKKYKEIDDFITTKLNTPIREVRRRKITGVKPRIGINLSGGGLSLILGASTQQYYKVKKSKF